MPASERRLAAILFTDMVGYTALGQRNESLSLALLEEQRKLIRPILGRHHGKEIKTIGDAFLVEFPNALDAVRCAYDVQRAVREFNISMPVEKRVRLRAGLHLGDVVESGGDISGDAVNVASRIEPLAEEGGVCLTRQVYDQVEGKFDLRLVSLGPKSLKNVEKPVEVFKIQMPWEEQGSAEGDYASRDRIAVLPFRNMSPDPNDEFFAEGITEEIISTVAGIGGLSVISRTSVMGYKGTTKKVEEIGKELRVGSVLEGSFRKAGNRIRVTAQLIDVAGDKHLWAQNYDRNLDDVFAVQSDVAKQVADALRVKILSPEKERIEKRPTENTAAYTLYLKGRSLWNKRGLDDIRRAAGLFEQAVKEDPEFAPGYAGWGDCYLLLRDWSLEPEENLQKTESLVARALELDPTLAEAHASKGLVLLDRYRPRDAEAEFRTAINLKPSYATAYMWYHNLLRAEARWEEAREQIEKALELDPLSGRINLNLGNFHSARGDHRKALEIYKRAAELGDPSAHGSIAAEYGRLKMFDEMKREFVTVTELLQNVFPMIGTEIEASIAYFEGDRATFKRLLPELEAHMGEPGVDAYWLAGAHFFLGETDEGFEWLERSYSRGETNIILSVKNDPDLDGVRGDPRYLDLLNRMGLG